MCGCCTGGGCRLKGAARDEKRRVERCLPRASPESSVSRNQTKPTWSRGPDALFLRSTPPRGLSPPRATPPPSTSMPCVLAEMPAPRRALATTREGAVAAPLMESEDEPGFGLLAIAESAWYAAMGGEGGRGKGGSGKGRSEETNAGGNACLCDSQL